jgi:hypothetical protein
MTVVATPKTGTIANYPVNQDRTVSKEITVVRTPVPGNLASTNVATKYSKRELQNRTYNFRTDEDKTKGKTFGAELSNRNLQSSSNKHNNQDMARNLKLPQRVWSNL